MGPSTRIDGDSRSDIARCLVAQLQWGRRLASTETGGGWPKPGRIRRASMGPSTRIDGDIRPAYGIRPRPAASMGPSTRIDGDRPRTSCLAPATGGFNGAVDSHRRRLQLDAPERD